MPQGTDNRRLQLATVAIRAGAVAGQVMPSRPAVDGRRAVAQDAMKRRDWATAVATLSSIDTDSAQALDPAELDALADAARWSGSVDSALATRERAHTLAVQGADPRMAAWTGDAADRVSRARSADRACHTRCATFMYMDGTVGIAELRQNLSLYLRRVGNGERLLVTDRNRPVAELGPPPSSGEALDRLIAAGRVTRPIRHGLPAPLQMDGNPQALSRALDEIRGER